MRTEALGMIARANYWLSRRWPTSLLAGAALAALALVATSCATTPAGPKADLGLRNFDVVEERVLYRGAQPKPGSYNKLHEMGITTVINLRQNNDTQPGEKEAVEAAGMIYRAIPMKGHGAPTPKEMAAALDIINSPANQPVFVHCRRGADRTGTVVAAYEIQFKCVSNANALGEADAHGMSRFELAMRRLIRSMAGSAACRNI